MVETTLDPDSGQDKRARRNAVVLAAAYGLYSCGTLVVITTGGLVGTMLAPDRGLATLPISTFVIGTALSTVPASMLMRRVGRRPGFLLGAALGVTSAVLSVYAIVIASFTLFCLGTFLHGIYQAFSQYYRFAAADVGSVGFRPKAISWVMVGGIAGAVFGPLIVIETKALLEPVLFAGSYLASALLGMIAIAVVSLVDIPHTYERGRASSGRPLPEILRQPRLIAAILCGMMAYGMMNLVMTATPIAMVDCGFTVDDSAWVVQWHALAMFAPSFFTGHVMARFGTERVVATGLLLLFGAAGAGLAGIDFANFAVGLVLLGLGWNFTFIGATAMVTECYRREERNKVQAVNDFAIFAMVATSSLTSGALLAGFGWSAVNWAVLPMVALAGLALLWLAHRRSAVAP
jgi:MFS family permease